MSDLPPTDPAARPVSVRLTRPASARLRRGHPWVFEPDVTRVSRPGAAGDVTVLYDDRNRPLAIGLLDPESAIRVRVFGPTGTRPGPELFAGRVTEAVERRRPLSESGATDGFRLVHGPNDGMPGVVIDRYAGTLVLKLYSAIWTPWVGDLVAIAAAIDGAERVVLRTSRNARAALEAAGWADGTVAAGAPLGGPVPFRENGIVFEADPLRGQKTGFFLDQRENRERVEALAADARVLNVFAYTGGFSLYAARGGASDVTSVDLSRPAVEAMERNFALNPSLAGVPHRAIRDDAFRALAELRGAPPFDVVVIDPPSFAKSAAERDRALASYARLARAGLAVLREGGVIALASCSSRVTAEEFFDNAAQAAADFGRPLAEIERTGHPLDHPVGFPESAYLKCVYARA